MNYILLCICCFFTSFSYAYVVLPYTWNSSTLDIQFCETASPIIQNMTKSIINDMNALDFFYIELKEQSTNSICNHHFTNGYGLTRYLIENNIIQYANIYISNELLQNVNVLYNVLLHELLHFVGLDHSTEVGMMNYSVRLDRYGTSTLYDHKWYMSIDDYLGIQSIYSN